MPAVGCGPRQRACRARSEQRGGPGSASLPHHFIIHFQEGRFIQKSGAMAHRYPPFCRAARRPASCSTRLSIVRWDPTIQLACAKIAGRRSMHRCQEFHRCRCCRLQGPCTTLQWDRPCSCRHGASSPSSTPATRPTTAALTKPASRSSATQRSAASAGTAASRPPAAAGEAAMGGKGLSQARMIQMAFPRAIEDRGAARTMLGMHGPNSAQTRPKPPHTPTAA